MPTSNSHSDDATAIRDALLDTYEKTMATLPVSAVRTAIRLDSFKLGWLANVWAFFAIVRSGIRWARPAASDEEAVRRYAEVSGKSHDGSQVDVDRIIGQLTLIDERAPYWHRPELAALKPAARAELLATADAVVRYFLDGRQSDDALLTEMQAAYAPCERSFQQDVDPSTPRPHRRGTRISDETMRDLAEAQRRYVQAWRRWFDDRQQGASAVH